MMRLPWLGPGLERAVVTAEIEANEAESEDELPSVKMSRARQWVAPAFPAGMPVGCSQ